jgi:hypothetical protein
MDLIAHTYDRLVLSKRAPSARAIEELIREFVAAAPIAPSQARYIHLILDGLEECEKDTQEKTMKLLEKLVSAAQSAGSTVCRVLVSGRAFRAGTKSLRNKHIVSLSDEKESLNGAISHYASSRLNTLRPKMLELGLTDSDMDDLGQNIVGKADGKSEASHCVSHSAHRMLPGMFLWTRLVLDYLSTNMFYKRDEVLLAVERLPRKLGEL